MTIQMLISTLVLDVTPLSLYVCEKDTGLAVGENINVV